jgi:hypothetical protein
MEAIKEILRTIYHGSSTKMVYTKTFESKRLILEAYKLLKEQKIESVWKCICAYRLAHITMRDAKNEDSFLRVKNYFSEASKCKSLGPLPLIYKVAVMMRLKEPKGSIEKEIIKITKTIKGIGEPKDNPQLQDQYLNMTELIIYIAGLDYKLIEGIGSTLEDRELKNILETFDRWKISTSKNLNYKLSGLTIPENLVKEEIEILVRNSNDPVIGFIMPYSERVEYLAKKDGKVRKGYVKWGDSLKRFFIQIMENPDISPHDLSDSIANSNIAHIRTLKKRLREYLSKIIKSEDGRNMEIFIDDRVTDYRLNPELNIVVGYNDMFFIFS